MYCRKDTADIGKKLSTSYGTGDLGLISKSSSSKSEKKQGSVVSSVKKKKEYQMGSKTTSPSKKWAEKCKKYFIGYYL